MSLQFTKQLFEAISKKDTVNALHFISQGALLDRTFKAGDVSGVTALHFAAAKGLKEVVRALLDKKHNVHLCNSLGWTAMHEAAREGHKDIVEMIHQHGGNIYVKTDNGENVLLLAVIYNRFDIGVYALEQTKGALLSDADLQQNTPLHMATILQRTAFLEYFLRYYYVKELLNTPGMGGDLPLHAQVTANPESAFISKFMEHGANPRLINKDQERPSQLAQRYRVTSKLLREKEFPLFYLCAKTIVQNPDLLSQAKDILPSILLENLDNVKKEIDDVSAQMSKLKFNA